MNPITLIVTPVGRSSSRGPVFYAHLGDRLVCTSHQPLLTSARVLLADGVAPETMLIMRQAGSSTDSLKATIGAAARLTVREKDQEGPVFRPWEPFARPDLEGGGTAPGEPAQAFLPPAGIEMAPG